MAQEVRLTGIHHVTLVARDIEAMVKFLTEVVGICLVKTTVNFDAQDQKHYYLGDEIGRPGTVVTFFESPNLADNRLGAGGMHHIAFGVEDEAALRAQIERLEGMGIGHSGIQDRGYFKSLYIREPEGLMVEFATAGPGFQMDGDQVEGKYRPGSVAAQ